MKHRWKSRKIEECILESVRPIQEAGDCMDPSSSHHRWFDAECSSLKTATVRTLRNTQVAQDPRAFEQLR